MTALRQFMSGDEFLTWCLDQEGKWELVNGHPVQIDIDPVTMMAGASETHDRIVTNLIIALGARLRGGPCWPKTSDQAARMPAGNFRRPDVTIDCGTPNPKSLESSAPSVFFEVLSPSTRPLDEVKKPEEYKSVPSLRHFVLLDQDSPRAWVWTRDEAGWSAADAEGVEAQIALSALEIALPLAEVYEGVTFAEA